MLSRSLALSCVVFGLLLPTLVTAGEPEPTTDPQEGSPRCKVKRAALVVGGVAPATMTVANDGQPCRMRYRIQGQTVPDEWKLVEAPKSGTVTFEGDEARYTPKPGFSGEDEFIVAVFGRAQTARAPARNGQFKVAVTVVPAAP